MNTYNPKEYLTLQAGPDENFSSTSNRAPCMVGTLKFEKVRLDLDVRFFYLLILTLQNLNLKLFDCFKHILILSQNYIHVNAVTVYSI